MGGMKNQDFVAPPSKETDPPAVKKRRYQVWKGRNVKSFSLFFLCCFPSLLLVSNCCLVFWLSLHFLVVVCVDLEWALWNLEFLWSLEWILGQEILNAKWVHKKRIKSITCNGIIPWFVLGDPNHIVLISCYEERIKNLCCTWFLIVHGVILWVYCSYL